MVFIGSTFWGGKHTFEPVSEQINSINKISISNGLYYRLYATTNTEHYFETWSSDLYVWDEDTLLHADFDNKVEAGNSAFSLKNTDTIIIKRRELLSDKWITIFTKNINVLEDFDITFVDKFAKSNTDYIYRISSIANGLETTSTECQVHSEFEGMYVVDKDNIFGTIYNVGENNTIVNTQAQVIATDNKYPTIVSKSDVNYESGNASGVFIRLNLNQGEIVDLNESLRYRLDFKNRLASHKPFILKMPDGRCWLANVSGNISETQEGHVDLKSISFDWCEVGDYNDMKTLYNNNLSDVDSKWW